LLLALRGVGPEAQDYAQKSGKSRAIANKFGMYWNVTKAGRASEQFPRSTTFAFRAKGLFVQGCGKVSCDRLGGKERGERDMRQILETEDHVAVPPMMYSDPFYRITYLIKEDIRKYKWIERRKRPATLVERGQG